MPARKQMAPKLPPLSSRKRFPCMIAPGKVLPPDAEVGALTAVAATAATAAPATATVATAYNWWRRRTRRRATTPPTATSKSWSRRTRGRFAAAFSPDADVVEVASKPGSSASEETKRHCKCHRRFRLVREPIGDWTHDERADVRYFGSTPHLPDPSGLQVALFKRVSQDMRRNPAWLTDDECSICMSGLKPKVVLSCACRHKLFHIKCVQEWHEKEDAHWQRLMNCKGACPKTRAASLTPLNVGWVTPSATETATQKERRKQRKKEKAKLDARRNAAKKVKRNAKAAAEEKNRRDAEAVLAPRTDDERWDFALQGWGKHVRRGRRIARDCRAAVSRGALRQSRSAPAGLRKAQKCVQRQATDPNWCAGVVGMSNKARKLDVRRRAVGEARVVNSERELVVPPSEALRRNKPVAS
ncbi:hypothetical protein B0H14DRAFT_2615343 [Mycena olivaceomarginata]|nr:hypothetical protein B0H14DRAFT_2615343 [Mycena olivaceomarginata]